MQYDFEMETMIEIAQMWSKMLVFICISWHDNLPEHRKLKFVYDEKSSSPIEVRRNVVRFSAESIGFLEISGFGTQIGHHDRKLIAFNSWEPFRSEVFDSNIDLSNDLTAETQHEPSCFQWTENIFKSSSNQESDLELKDPI